MRAGTAFSWRADQLRFGITPRLEHSHSNTLWGNLSRLVGSVKLSRLNFCRRTQLRWMSWWLLGTERLPSIKS